MALTASFIADFSSFMDATKEAVAAMTGMKQTAEELGPSVDKGVEDSFESYVKLGAQIRETAGVAVQASQQFIDAYSQEQEAVVGLTTALQAQGQATPEIIQQYADLAKQFQSTTKYAGDALTGVEATLTTIGQVGPENMEAALQAVTNLASGLNIDLNQAATMVAKAFASGGESLGKLKGVIGDTIDPAKEAAGVLDAINQKFAGQAQSDLQTWSGQVAQMNNQLSDFNSGVGKVLVDTLSSVLGAFQALPQGVQSFTIGVVAIGTALAPVLISLSSLITLLSTTGLGAGIVSAFTSIAAFLGPAGWIAIGVVALAGIIYKNWDSITSWTKSLYESIKYWLVDKFNSLVAMIKAPIDAIVGQFQSLYNTLVGHSIVPDTIDGIADQFSRLDEVMVQPVTAAADAVRAQLALMQYQMRANAILSRNSLFTTAGQLEEIAALPIPFGGSGGGSGGSAGSAAPVTVNNTFNLVDTESNLARRVSELIMQTVRSGTQLAAQ